jgi:UDP-N-acetylglucosamine:LPS N-acetylglucosamine transferase
MEACKPKRLLAISSGGGHWDELVLLQPAFEGFATTYATTMHGQAQRDGIAARIVTDSNRNSRLDLLRTAWDVLRLVAEIRPHYVVSTGATPGLIALLVGKLFGARTIWIDSIANAETLSMSGRMARPVADLHLSQWQHLADGRATRFMGSVL